MSDLRHQLAAELARQENTWGHVAPERWRAVMQYAGQRILDVGCSNGVYVRRLRQLGYQAYGADLLQAPGWIEKPPPFLMSDARFLPFADNSFDTIISFETLEHVPDPARALQDYHRVCRRHVILSVPNAEKQAILAEAGLNFNHWIDRTHINFYSLEAIKALAERCGFKVMVAAPIMPTMPGLPLLYGVGLPRTVASFLARAILKISVRKFYMSLLVVAKKV